MQSLVNRLALQIHLPLRQILINRVMIALELILPQLARFTLLHKHQMRQLIFPQLPIVLRFTVNYSPIRSRQIGQILDLSRIQDDTRTYHGTYTMQYNSMFLVTGRQLYH